MKKVYTKPEIFYESFSLSQNIAGDCEEKTNNPSNNACAFDFSGINVFLSSMAGICDGIQVNPDSYGGDGEFNGFCYHVFTGRNLFNS